MDNEQLKAARITLGLTEAEAADLLEVDVSSVQKWERDPSKPSHRAAPARVARLLSAYLSGFRPDDWPERLAEVARRKAEIDAVRV